MVIFYSKLLVYQMVFHFTFHNPSRWGESHTLIFPEILRIPDPSRPNCKKAFVCWRQLDLGWCFGSQLVIGKRLSIRSISIQWFSWMELWLHPYSVIFSVIRASQGATNSFQTKLVPFLIFLAMFFSKVSYSSTMLTMLYTFDLRKDSWFSLLHS